MKRLCKTCKAWENEKCHLSAPIFANYPASGVASIRRRADWPGTFESDWCLDWKPRKRGTCGDCEFHASGNIGETACHHSSPPSMAFDLYGPDWWCEHWMPKEDE